MAKQYGYAGLERLGTDSPEQARNIRGRLHNRRSEDWDASRITIYMQRVRNDFAGSVAEQVKRNIDEVTSTYDDDMEPLFVY